GTQRLVATELARVSAELERIARDPVHPDRAAAGRELAWLTLWIGWVSKHLAAANAALAKPLDEALSRRASDEFPRRLRLRVRELQKALEPLYGASRKSGSLPGAGHVHSALLHLSPWARNAPDPARFPELGEGALGAYFDLMDAWRAFQKAERDASVGALK
ncbi:MAG: hypothetical protein HY554_19345, partial [Elusimicrobia bacterium]|nr:hypothetical protein [Elusimicrobiota bacterium]